MFRRLLAALCGVAAITACAGAAPASADATLALEAASIEAKGVSTAVALVYKCDPGSGDLGFWATVTQRQNTSTVTGSAAGGFYNSERLTCTGQPQSKTMHVPANSGFYKSGKAALFEVYMYTCCSTTSLITSGRIGSEPNVPLPPEPAGDSFIQAANHGAILGNGLAVTVPIAYRCREPVVAGQIFATLAEKVGLATIRDDADPIRSDTGSLTCDGANRTDSLFFRAPENTFFKAGPAFLSVGLEIYDGIGTLTAHDYRTVALRK